MKSYSFKLSIALAVLVVFGIFILNSTVAEKHCSELAWEGDYEINSIEDVRALSGYTEAKGNLSIRDSGLTNLRGLECLTSVDGDLTHVIPPCFRVKDKMEIFNMIRVKKRLFWKVVAII